MAALNGTNGSDLPIKHSQGLVVSNTTSTNPNSALLKKLESFKATWLRVCWHDYTSTSRCRLIPMSRVSFLLERCQPLVLTITMASLGMLQNDTMISEVTGTGVYAAIPDWSSLRSGPVQGHATVFLDFKTIDGAEAVLCPRTLLRTAVRSAEEQGLSLLVGFELEFVILEKHSETGYRQLANNAHGWSSTRAIADVGCDKSFNSLFDELLECLMGASINIEQLHTECAPGQYEIVLPPLPPLEACDALLQARHIVEAVAARHGFHMTLHPKPFASSTGSASHVHMSLSSPGGNDADIYEPFYAGILRHYSALISLTYPSPSSYDRMVDSLWAGGRWVTWGTQNKEAPLRKCKDSHWEMKTFDGLANPYMAMAAIIAAGVHGVSTKEPLIWGDCVKDPAKLTAEQRAELNVTTRFPKDLEDALKALEEDEDLKHILGKDFVERYLCVKRGELRILNPMSDEQRRQWVLERY